MDSIDRNTKWSTYEANVQAYRSHMISSQSFLLAVGAVLLGKNMVLLTVCVVVAMIQLWYIWFREIRAGTIIVDYYKFDLGSKFNKNGDALRNGEKELDEDTFVRNRAVYHKVRKAMGIEKKKLKRTFRTTRFKLDILMPITFR